MAKAQPTRPLADGAFSQRTIKLYELGLLLAELEWHVQHAVLLESPDHADKVILKLRTIRRLGPLAVGSETWQGMNEKIMAEVDDNYYRYPTEAAVELFGEALEQLEEEYRLGDFPRARAEWCRSLLGTTIANELHESFANRIPEQEYYVLELGRLVGEILWPADLYLHLYEDSPEPEASNSTGGLNADKCANGDEPQGSRPAHFGGSGLMYSLDFLGNTEREPGELPVTDIAIADLKGAWRRAKMSPEVWPARETALTPCKLFELLDGAIRSAAKDTEAALALSIGKLTNMDLNILESLLAAEGKAMRGEAIMASIEDIKGQCSTGTAKQRLAELVKRRVLNRVVGQNGGYVLGIPSAVAEHLIATNQG